MKFTLDLPFRPTLQSEGVWTMEVRHAWLHFFRIIVLKLKRGYKEFDESFSGHVTADGSQTTGQDA